MSLLSVHGWSGLKLVLVIDEEVWMSSNNKGGKGSAGTMVSPHGT